MDGRRIGDSTAIIAALEERFPDAPLYPSDPGQRERALELEDFFDEEVGPHTRRLAFHELSRDPERLAPLLERTTPAPLNRMRRISMAYAKTLTALRFAAGSAQAADRSRAKIIAGLNRLEQELGDGEYLVGDSFSVADLAAASLFYPIVLPEEGPVPPDEPPARGLQRFRERLEGRRGFKWVAEMFRRHRKPARAASTAQ
jgi:glutathione S-transferase